MSGIPVQKQHRMAWRLAHLLRVDIHKIFSPLEMWAVGAFIPDPVAIEKLMVERGQYDDKADPCESLYDAIGRVYGDEALRIVKRLVGGEEEGEGEKS